MNFSNNKKLMKLISLIAVLVLMTTLFAGCKKDEPTGETEDTSLNLNLNLDTESQPTETETQPTETEAVVNEKSATVTSQMNIRSAPSTTGSAVIGTLYAGDKLIVERREEVVGIWWAYISSPMEGWVCMDYVEMDIPDAANDNISTPGETAPVTEDEPDDQSSTTSGTKGVVTAAGGLMIRSEASTNGEVKGLYNKGDVVTILETKNGWGRTNKGWIKLQYVNTSGTTSNTANNNTTTDNKTDAPTGNGSTTVQLRGVVKATKLNIRPNANTNGDPIGSYVYGDRVEILEKSGNWGRTNKGWISLDHVYQDGTTGTKTATGIVTGTELRIRTGPGTGYDVVGSLNKGEKVSILEQFTYNGTTWGCIRNGWISLAYVDIDGDIANDSNYADASPVGKVGIITGNGVRIRSGAGTDYEVVGSLNAGDDVTIQDQKTVGNTTWGKINGGWVSMDYVELG